jgi:hypothetical protein
MNLWNSQTEIQFFQEALRHFASPEKLFYKHGKNYFAYFPKGVSAKGQTLQSRNFLIGKFTETWAKKFFEPIASEHGLFAVNSVVCDEIGLSNRSSADLAFCTTNDVIQPPGNIKLIFEIKMSIVSNYQFKHPGNVEFIDDYKSHQGNPSLLRSDSMLKAIGKAINIRVAGLNSANIPVVVLGNSPVSDAYLHKVDFLKTAGVTQGFWSLYPNPTDSVHNKQSENSGFVTLNNTDEVKTKCAEILTTELNYFSAMIPKKYLGEIIRISNEETTDEAKAEKFLNLLRKL